MYSIIILQTMCIVYLCVYYIPFCVYFCLQSLINIDFMTLGEKITLLRKKVNLSQLELADLVGVSRDSIGKYERNDILPTIDKAKRMAEALKVSLDFLVSEDAEEKQTTIDKLMNNRIIELNKLNDIEKDKILSIVDAFIRDTKAKKAYS